MKELWRLILLGLIANLLIVGIPLGIDSLKADTNIELPCASCDSVGVSALAKYNAMSTSAYIGQCAVGGIVLLGYLFFCGFIVEELRRNG